jgi:NAD(P)-dependent dehydrogenase (short-subunit alcohol dehydrogenase family)
MPSVKTALVTGGARRLGAAMVLDLVRRGWKVWIHYRGSADEALSLSRRVGSLGGQAPLVQADLAESGGAEALVQALSLDPPSLIIHSASLWTEDTAATAQSEAWERSHRLHAWAAVVLARALSGWQNGDRAQGHLVTLLDARLRDRDAQHFSYAFAKRELALLTRYLAAEFAPVRVNGIAPGMVLRDEGTAAAAWTKMGRDFIPLKRTGRPAEIIKALRFLVDNDYVTGQILAVDGGRHLKGDLFGSI